MGKLGPNNKIFDLQTMFQKCNWFVNRGLSVCVIVLSISLPNNVAVEEVLDTIQTQ